MPEVLLAQAGGHFETAMSGDIAGGSYGGGTEQVWVSDGPQMPYKQQISNALGATAQGIANTIDGVVELGVKGTWNAPVARPASSIAALPALALGGTQAYTEIQATLQQQFSAEIQNPGGKALGQLAGQLLEPIGQGITQARNYSESKLGDGITTFMFGTAQPALEVTGFLGGVSALRGGAAAVGLDAASLSAAREGANLVAQDLGANLRSGLNALADVLPSGSGTGMQGLRYEVGAVGDLSNVRPGSMLAGAEAADAQAAFRANFVGPTTGKSGYLSMNELSDAAYVKYQGFVDQGYTNAVQDLKDGVFKIRPGVSENTVLGARTDIFARVNMNRWLAGEGISEGANSMVQVNRYLRDPAGSSAYRILDLSIPGANQIYDASLANKSWSLPQVQGFYNYSGGSRITIVRPTANPAGGSYSLY